MVFEIFETDQFKANLEDAAFWLYSHNLELSKEFADRKLLELEQEITTLKGHLINNPRIGRTADFVETRCFPVYCGRYLITWMINEATKTITLIQFSDLKYPKELRTFHFDD